MTNVTDTALLARLARIEGQVRGVSAMVQHGRPALDIVTQIAALRGALEAVAVEVIERAAAQSAGGELDPAAVEVLAATRRLLRCH